MKKITVLTVFVLALLAAGCGDFKYPRKTIDICNALHLVFKGPRTSTDVVYRTLDVRNDGGDGVRFWVFYDTDGNHILNHEKGENIQDGFLGEGSEGHWEIKIPQGSAIAVTAVFTESNMELLWFPTEGESCGTWTGNLERRAPTHCSEDGCFDDDGNLIPEDELNDDYGDDATYPTDATQ